GVWSPDIEQTFQEALDLYPPCDHCKIILSDEGKMYGRNELIACYMKLRTGKTRKRKQVSNHIQVLAGRKSREIQSKLKDQVSQDKPFQTMATMSSAQLFSAPSRQAKLGPSGPQATELFQFWVRAAPSPLTPAPTCSISPSLAGSGTARLQRMEFSAFVEPPNAVDSLFQRHQSAVSQSRSPAPGHGEEAGASGGSGGFYGLSSKYESLELMTLTCSSKVCFFGKQVVEKVETERAQLKDRRFVYLLLCFPMCEYLADSLHKLWRLPELYMMISVLENFTILQVLINTDTQELLLCTAYIFEVSTSERGAQNHIYHLVRD
ncbi:transcriptional enhancer factor TEF-4 isoform X1, partial [Sigmodon hispidus]